MDRGVGYLGVACNPPPLLINTLISGLRSRGGGLLDEVVPEVFTKYGLRFLLNTEAAG